MSDAKERLAEARQAERQARADWLYSLGVAQSRLAPGAIAQDAVDRVKDSATSVVETATGAVRKRPGTIVAVGAAIGLFIFRKPIAATVRKQITRYKESKDPVAPLNAPEPSGGPIPDPTPKTILTEEVTP